MVMAHVTEQPRVVPGELSRIQRVEVAATGSDLYLRELADVVSKCCSVHSMQYQHASYTSMESHK